MNTMTDGGFHFSQCRRRPNKMFFSPLSLYLITFIILIYVAFRHLSALDSPFFSPKDRSTIKLKPGLARKQWVQYLCSLYVSSRLNSIGFALNHRISNIHAVIRSFLSPSNTIFSPMLKIIDANFMQMLLFDSVHDTAFILVFNIRE